MGNGGRTRHRPRPGRAAENVLSALVLSCSTCGMWGCCHFLNSFIEVQFTYQTTHPVKECRSVVFTYLQTCMVRTTVNFTTFSSPQKETPPPLATPSRTPSPFIPGSQQSALYLDLRTFHVNGFTQYLLSCDWHEVSVFSHMVALSELHSSLLLSNIPRCGYRAHTRVIHGYLNLRTTHTI